MKTHVVFFGPGNPSISAQILQDVLPLLNTLGQVDVVDLANTLPDLYTPENLQSYVKRNFLKQIEHHDSLNNMDQLTSRLINSDFLVMIFPMYNFFMPSNVKAWIDNVAQNGKTFKYTEYGPVGLLNVKNALVIQVTGGTMQNSSKDFTTPYIDFMLKFMGVKNVNHTGIFGSRFKPYSESKKDLLEQVKNVISSIQTVTD